MTFKLSTELIAHPLHWFRLVFDRFQMGDFAGEKLAEAQALKHKLPTYIPVNQFAIGRDWPGLSRKVSSNSSTHNPGI